MLNVGVLCKAVLDCWIGTTESFVLSGRLSVLENELHLR